MAKETRGLIAELIDVGTGEIPHLYRGECPGEREPLARDGDCPACAVLEAASRACESEQGDKAC